MTLNITLYSLGHWFQHLGIMCENLNILHGVQRFTQYCLLSTHFTIGYLPTEANELASTMVSFFQQCHQYLSYDTAPIPSSCCQEVLAKLTVTSEPNEVTTISYIYNILFVHACQCHQLTKISL